MEIKYGCSTCVYGRKKYSKSTLENMKKSELIELLNIAQHNYEVLLETYGNMTAFAKSIMENLEME